MLNILVIVLVAWGSAEIGNRLRDNPLGEIYLTPEDRIRQSLADFPATSLRSGDDVNRINLSEFKAFVEQKSSVILDARPASIYGFGHVPGALSLPRQDFIASYLAILRIHGIERNQVVAIYCSSNECEDSQLVGKMMYQLGYDKIFVFRGGWDEWCENLLPQQSLNK